MPPVARENVIADPFGTLTALQPIIREKNPVRTFLIHNKTTNGNTLIVSFGGSIESKNRWRLAPNQWKRLTKEETSFKDNADGLWVVREIFVGGAGVAVITAYDFDATFWDNPDQLMKGRGSVD